VGYGKVGVQSIKAVISPKRDKIERKLLFLPNKVIYDVSISAKMYDIE